MTLLPHQAPADDVNTALTEIQQIAAEELEEEKNPEDDQVPEMPDGDLALPDGASLVNLTSESSTSTSMQPEKFPHTLTEALQEDRSFWAGIWQLAVFLRCGKNGIDSKFLKKAEVVRRRSTKMNWQQPLGFPALVS